LDSFKSVKDHASISFSLTNPALKDGENISRNYTRTGEDTSSPLSWSRAQNGTKSYVIILEDPVVLGGTFTHWVLYNLSATTTGLTEEGGKKQTIIKAQAKGKATLDALHSAGCARPKRRTAIYSGYMPSALQV